MGDFNYGDNVLILGTGKIGQIVGYHHEKYDQRFYPVQIYNHDNTTNGGQYDIAADRLILNPVTHLQAEVNQLKQALMYTQKNTDVEKQVQLLRESLEEAREIIKQLIEEERLHESGAVARLKKWVEK